MGHLMRHFVGPALAILLVLALPLLLTWAGGAFFTWDAGWAFADYQARVNFAAISVLVAALLLVFFPILG